MVPDYRPDPVVESARRAAEKHREYSATPMRRALDLLVAIFCLTVFGPLILLIAVLIKLNSPEAILYMPQMVGQHGKVFSLFRFRTMSVDLLNAEQRLTPIGKFIRNYSLDHLPMLINLLIGDLTLVGPRPMELEVVDFQDKSWQQYFSVKPGLFNYAVLKLGKFGLSHASVTRR